MAPLPGFDFHLKADAFVDYLRTYAMECEGKFSITLIKESGQGYHVVLHYVGATEKVRLGVVTQGYLESSWIVADILSTNFAVGNAFSPRIQDDIDRLMRNADGCIRLTVEHGEVVRADYHYGELWP